MAQTKGVIKRTDFFYIDPLAIKRREGWNPRFDFGDMEQLEKSLKINGMMNPIRVKRDESGEGFVLIDGDRRFTAVENLMEKGIKFESGIPAIIEPKAATDMQLLIKMFEANTGKSFTPIEEANAFKRMRSAGMTIHEISATTSRSVSHVSQQLDLLGADAAVTDAIKEGKITATLGRDISSKAKGDKKLQKELVAKASTGKQGTNAVKAIVKNITRRAPTPKQQANKKLVPPAVDVLDTLETKLALMTKEIRSEIESLDGDGLLLVKTGILLGIQFARGMKVDLDIYG